MQNVIDKYTHAKDRFLKRHGRSIETEQINAMEELVRLNKVVSMSATQNHDRVQASLRINNEEFTCIYVKSTGDIITFLDLGECKHHRKRPKYIQNGNRRARRGRG